MNLLSLKSEGLKFAYNKWLLITSFFLGILIIALSLILNTPVQEINSNFITNQLLQSFYLGQVGFTLIATLYFSEEFSNNSIRTSLLSNPNRFCFMSSKVVSLVFFETILFILYATITIITLCFCFNESISVYRVLPLIPVYISTIEITLITAGFVILSGSFVLPIAIMFPLILGLGQLLLQISKFMVFLPVLSSMNSFLIDFTPIYPTPVNGLIIQALWALGIMFFSFCILNKKLVR